MGKHYIPQYYLRGFSENLEADKPLIWVYEKGKREPFRTQLANVAHETKFYSQDVEEYLANAIESPANVVLNKIRNTQSITKEDRLVLARYMVTMWKRVPQSKTRFRDWGPKFVDDVFADMDQEFIHLVQKHPAMRNSIEKARGQLRGLYPEYQRELPHEIWMQTIMKGELQDEVSQTLARMKWRFLTCDEQAGFLTSDNPFYFFEGIGVVHPQSEFHFPIASDIAIWGSWRNDLSDGYTRTNSSVISQLNRRIASSATRYIFHSSNQDWVSKLVARSHKPRVIRPK